MTSYTHRTVHGEFYQLLTLTDDVDLNEKLAAWEVFRTLTEPLVRLEENPL